MSASSQELAGRVAIVTGSSRGLGLETAQVLASAGAEVVLSDLPGSQLEQAAASVDPPERAAYHPVDISEQDSVRELVAFTVQRFGRLDILVNNAAQTGLDGDVDVLSMEPDVWDGIFAVNARGTMLMAKAALPALFESDAAAIVNVGSGMADAGDDATTAYACTKAVVKTLTYYLATQYAARGVRCNCVAPGLINTEALRSSFPEPIKDAVLGSMSLGRVAEPSDVAQAILYLASGRSSYLTGQVLHVDGGYFSHLPHVAEVRRAVEQLTRESGAAGTP